MARRQYPARQIQEATRLKSRFLANMSHELRTPLNAILGFNQILARDESIKGEQRESVEVVGRSGHHLLTLINDVLEISKIEAGQTTMRAETVGLSRLLSSIEDMFRLRCENKGLELVVERGDHLPQYIRTDDGKLRQILINLVGNAVKFTEQGAVTLRMGFLTSNGRQGRLSVEVEDQGPGIASEDVEQLFDVFTQTDAGRRASEGSGLGLAISQEYIRLLGGEIVVRSQLGCGTVFSFEIETEATESSQPDGEPAQRRVLGLAPGQETYRILVVDDAWENRQLLRRLLEPLGFEVREASDGQAGLAELERWEPHLVWMDMRMPVMDGREATRRIKETPKGQATVIIALTASAFEEEKALILAAGCDGLVRKPFREAEIYDVLAANLGVSFTYTDDAPDQTTLPQQGALSEDAARVQLASGEIQAQWVASLKAAATNADGDQLRELISTIQAEHGDLADLLSLFVHEYRFDRIRSLLD